MTSFFTQFKNAFSGQNQNNQIALHNIQRLQDIMRNPPPSEHLYTLLNEWESDNNLEIHNYSFMLWITLAVVCLILTFILHYGFLLLSIGLVIYAFVKRTSTSARDDLIKHMQNYWLERKYQIYFRQSRYSEIDDFSDNHSNNAHENRQQKWAQFDHPFSFPYFQLGNHANDIQHCIYGEWHIQGKDYPFILFNYHYVDKNVDKDEDGKETISYDHHDLYGVMVEGFPGRGTSISSQQKRQSRLGVKWTSGDIKFDQAYQLSGIDEIHLAKFFSPQNILSLETAMQSFHGDFYVHPQTSMLCWLFKKNILQHSSEDLSIRNVHELAESLLQLKMPEFEKMTHIMQTLIPELSS